ncbi:hypothetical protein [Cyanobium sp. ATX 6F1]|uniref:hypothetical protein n=1 Tax=unclassified Cyanobium TaxID=2627006 RepID=UPI0020CB982F|nr:hypothetical protein [Cyanobium sp. ATX 6F1]MCP9915749.1 hypothetical protein [Cyanobium sp. ATX 6F1]
MGDQATRVVCAFAAITSLIIVCARSPGLQGIDLPFLALVVAPFLLLGLMAGSVRERSSDARVLFILTLFLALGGTFLLALHAPIPNTGPEPGLAQSVVMIGVPLLQLIAVILLGLILRLRRMLAS